eukprot:CAMPEP_0115004320 /NCGR_PEP_ID=MMETSP0216-20121206/19125_1 /TAXON_ID=223996 /ORGANISM="Protocruzia adherens, Strain Boccale" /LENGTH=226 /DNA_ID=CAMNT_0002370271 /DNA_START=522 /DNA_END=1202 /DNA_ORIENTATION=-
MAFSFSTIHWLQQAPCFINSIFFSGNDNGKPGQEAGETWRKQGEEDWRLFLTLRQRELKQGGFLYASTIQFGESPTEGLIGDETTNQNGMSALVRVLERHECEEYKANFNLPMIIRSHEDYVQPLKGENSISLREDHYLDFKFKIEQFTQMIESGNVDKFLDIMKEGNKAVTGSFYKAQLEKIPKLSHEERDQIWNDIYEEMYQTLTPVFQKDQGFSYCEMVFSKH